MLSVVVSRRPSVEEGSRSKASKATRARREGGAWEGESARGRRVPGRCRGVGDAASARVARVATRGTRGVRDEVCGRGGITRIFPRASWTIFVPRERGGKARFGWAVIGSWGTRNEDLRCPHIISFPRTSAAGATNARPPRAAVARSTRSLSRISASDNLFLFASWQRLASTPRRARWWRLPARRRRQSPRAAGAPGVTWGGVWPRRRGMKAGSRAGDRVWIMTATMSRTRAPTGVASALGAGAAG
jgi:hypothetical protein